VNGLLYLPNLYSNNLTVISGATNSVVGSIPVGVNPWGVAYDSVNGYLYVSNSGGDNVSVIDAATFAPVGSITVGTGLSGVAYDSSSGDVYVADSGSSTVAIIDPATNEVVGNIPVGNSPWDLIYDSRDGNLYVTNAGSDNVSVIDGSSNRVVASVPAGNSPTSICFQAGSDLLYVANPDSNNVTVFNGSINSQVTTVASSAPYPRGVVCDPDNGLTYVMDEQAGTVDMINGTTNSLFGSIPVGSYPNYGIYDNLNGNIYIADLLAFMVYVIAPTSSPGIHIDYFQATPSPLVIGGTSYLNVSAAGGQPPYTYAYAGLPKGCVTANTPALACKPTTTGSFTIRAFVNDTRGNSSSATAALTVANLSMTISSVSVSPPSYSLAVGGNVGLTAIATCKGGPCSPGITYAWTLTNALGALNSSSGRTVRFTAGGTAGIDTLFVNATLSGLTVESPAVPITLLPSLSSVAITPGSSTLQVRATANFTASVACTGGPCPAGATYAWSLNNTLGSVNSSTGPQTTFTAGSKAGSVTMTVNATLNGMTATSSATITLTSPPTLSSVYVSPSPASVVANGVQEFSAAPTCSGGTCPSGTAYSWSLTNSLGELSSSSGPSVAFTAGADGGTVTLFVNATLDGKTVQSSPVVITIEKSSPTPTTGFLGLSGNLGYMVVGVVVAVVVAIIVVLLLMRRRNSAKSQGQPVHGNSAMYSPNAPSEDTSSPPPSPGPYPPPPPS
jgi:YVTN family beta-propeller protein